MRRTAPPDHRGGGNRDLVLQVTLTQRTVVGGHRTEVKQESMHSSFPRTRTTRQLHKRVVGNGLFILVGQQCRHQVLAVLRPLRIALGLLQRHQQPELDQPSAESRRACGKCQPRYPPASALPRDDG